MGPTLTALSSTACSAGSGTLVLSGCSAASGSVLTVFGTSFGRVSGSVVVSGVGPAGVSCGVVSGSVTFTNAASGASVLQCVLSVVPVSPAVSVAGGVWGSLSVTVNGVTSVTVGVGVMFTPSGQSGFHFCPSIVPLSFFLLPCHAFSTKFSLLPILVSTRSRVAFLFGFPLMSALLLAWFQRPAPSLLSLVVSWHGSY